MGTSKILIDGVGIDLTADTVAENKMLSGIKAHDANGDAVTGNIPSKAAQTYTPGTSAQTISAGQYLNGAQTIRGDVNLISTNIKNGKTIFGVAGTLQPAKTEQGKTLTLGTAAPATVTPDSGKVLSSVHVVLDTSVIKAENIAKDVTMLGITGTHEGSGGDNNIFVRESQDIAFVSPQPGAPPMFTITFPNDARRPSGTPSRVIVQGLTFSVGYGTEDPALNILSLYYDSGNDDFYTVYGTDRGGAYELNSEGSIDFFDITENKAAFLIALGITFEILESFAFRKFTMIEFFD